MSISSSKETDPALPQLNYWKTWKKIEPTTFPDIYFLYVSTLICSYDTWLSCVASFYPQLNFFFICNEPGFHNLNYIARYLKILKQNLMMRSIHRYWIINHPLPTSVCLQDICTTFFNYVVFFMSVDIDVQLNKVWWFGTECIKF